MPHDPLPTTAAGTWVQITCEDREALVSRNGGRYDGFKVAAGRTDMDGQFGEPTIFTEWYDSLTGSDESVLRDYRYPGRRTPDDPYPKDVRPCEHYRWEPDHAK